MQSDFYDNAALYVEQQLELYGNEVIFDIAPDGGGEAIKDPVDIPEWQLSESLDEFERLISNCKKCALHKTRNKFVFGQGDADADMMLIGEAPGADEDRLGKPFVGRAGDLLTRMLSAINIDRNSVYIANILKCRPPQNRDPQPEEIACCTPFLMKQIEMVRPRIILCLGRFAAHVLLKTTDSLSHLRGQKYKFQNSDLLVTYHPAALLRTPSLKREAWEDLKMVQRLFIQLKGDN